MERIIGLAVVVIGAKSIADLEAVIGGYTDVALFKQSMQVRSKKQTIADDVWPIFSKWSNMSGFKRWQGMFTSYCTGTIISISYCNAESPLTEPWSNQNGRSVSLSRLLGGYRHRSVSLVWPRPLPACFPYSTTFPNL